MNIVSQAAIYETVNQIIVDVRSPGEFSAYHVQGSISMPLFTDEERIEIGTTYKQVSTLEAKKLGITYTANKLDAWMNKIIEWTEKYDRVILYCQRGGMRSKSLVSLFNSIGFDQVHQLEGGIKGHRAYILEILPDVLKQKTFVVLHGHTGVGKTLLLKELDKQNIGILDLEKMAEHAGSVFGDIMYPIKSPSQKQFEEKLFYNLINSKTSYIFTESESRRIGHVSLPEWMMEKMVDGKHILIQADLKVRIFNLISDYDAKGQEEALIKCVQILRKRISSEIADQMIEAINQGEIESFVGSMLTSYYDRLYQHSIDQYKFDFNINFLNLKQATEALVAVYRKELQ